MRGAKGSVRLEAGRLSFEWPGLAAWEGLRVTCRESGGAEHAAAGWRSLGDGRYAAATGPLQVLLEVREGGTGGNSAGRLELRLEVGAGRRIALSEAGLAGTLSVNGGRPRWLVASGYQSWDEAHVLPVPAAGGTSAEARPPRESWWTAGAADEHGLGLAAAAAEARAAATRFMLSRSEDATLAATWCQPRDYGRPLPLAELAPDAGWRAEPLLLAAGDDVHRQLRGLTVRDGGAPGPEAPRGWLSWYHYGPSAGPDEVLAHSRLLAGEPYRSLGYTVVQVDDGWQMAYGDWVPNSRFPGGFPPLAAELERRGQRLGLWLAPFLVGEGSDLDRQAPEEWFFHDPKSGARATDPRHVVFGPMHVLDGGHPGVQSYLRDLFARLRADGVRYFKVDFLYVAGYPGVVALRHGLAAIREGAGDAFLLASGAPLLPVAGLVDACRVGPDTATPWFDFESATIRPATFGDEVLNVCRNAAALHHLGGWYRLDPDVALTGGNLSLEQGRQLATVAVLSGGPFFAADDLAGLDPARRALLTNPEVLALAGGEPAVPDWEPHESGRPASRWRRDGVLAVFNWDPEPRTLELPADAAAGARDLWARQDLDRHQGKAAELEVPGHGVRLLRLGGHP